MAKDDTRPKRKGWADDDAHGYFGVSRGWAAGLMMILPLLVLYEISVTLLHSVDAYAAAEEWLKWPLGALEGREVIVFNMIVIIAVTAAIAHLVRRRELKPYIFPFMLLESAAYALILLSIQQPIMDASEVLFRAPAVGAALPTVLAAGGTTGNVISDIVSTTGAAVYEEIIFRGVLMTALFFLLYDALKAPAVVAGAISIVAAAALFSALHCMGDSGAFEPSRFGFRLSAALILSGLFLVRGIGVAVYTHAIFNVLSVFGQQQ